MKVGSGYVLRSYLLIFSYGHVSITMVTPLMTVCWLRVVLYLPYCVCLLLLQRPPSLSPSEKLKEYFEDYGSVKEVTIKYDRDTQKSRSDPVLTQMYVYTQSSHTSSAGV